MLISRKIAPFLLMSLFSFCLLSMPQPPKEVLEAEPVARLYGYWQNLKNPKDIIRIELGPEGQAEIIGLDFSKITSIPTSFWDTQDIVALKGHGVKAYGKTLLEKANGKKVPLQLTLELGSDDVLNVQKRWQDQQPMNESMHYIWQANNSPAVKTYLDVLRLRARTLLRIRFDTLPQNTERYCRPNLGLSHFVKRNDFRCSQKLLNQGVKKEDVLHAVRSVDYNLLKLLLKNFDVTKLNVNDQNKIMDQLTFSAEENTQTYLTTFEKDPHYVLTYLDENAVINLLLEKNFQFFPLPDDKLHKTSPNWEPPWVVEEQIAKANPNQFNFTGHANEPSEVEAYLKQALDPNGLLLRLSNGMKRVIPTTNDFDWVLAWGVRRTGLDGSVLLKNIMDGKGLKSVPPISNEAMLLFAANFKKWILTCDALQIMKQLVERGGDVNAQVIWNHVTYDLATIACLFGTLELVQYLHSVGTDFSHAILTLHEKISETDPYRSLNGIPPSWGMINEQLEIKAERLNILAFLSKKVTSK